MTLPQVFATHDVTAVVRLRDRDDFVTTHFYSPGTSLLLVTTTGVHYRLCADACVFTTGVLTRVCLLQVFGTHDVTAVVRLRDRDDYVTMKVNLLENIT